MPKVKSEEKKFGLLVISFIWSFQILDMFKRLKSTIKQANLCSRTSKWTTIFISNWLRGFQNYDIFVRTCKISLFKFNTYHRWIYDSIDGPIREFCQKFVYSFVNNECHENDDTIDYGENDRSYKSWLIVIDLKVSTCPRKVIMKKGLVWHVYLFFTLNWTELGLKCSTLSVKC